MLGIIITVIFKAIFTISKVVLTKFPHRSVALSRLDAARTYTIEVPTLASSRTPAGVERMERALCLLRKEYWDRVSSFLSCSAQPLLMQN